MKKINGLILIVKNIEKSLDFYNVLGFSIRNKIEGIAVTVSIDNFWIELLKETEVVTAEYKKGLNSNQRGVGSFLQIEVDDVDKYHNELLKKGIKSNDHPKDFPWGYREFNITDPDGYILNFYSYLDKN